MPRRILFGQLVAVMLVTASPVLADASAVSPIELYGAEIQFDVYRNGDLVGFHQVRFNENGARLTVTSDFQLQVKLLFFSAYRFAYRSRETWRHGVLEELEAEVDDNGELVRISEAGFRPGDYPTTHWSAGVLARERVFNTLIGRFNDVRIQPAGVEMVSTENGEISATRFVYSGELQNEVWYDQQRRWVKMRFKGNDGSLIDYECVRCQGGEQETARR